MNQRIDWSEHHCTDWVCRHRPQECLRCGAQLESELDFKTAICPDCWTDADDEPDERRAP